MPVDLPEKYATIVRKVVDSGAFHDSDAAIQHAISLLEDEQRRTADRNQTVDEQDSAIDESHDVWLERLQTFVARQRPTGHPVDDSRESIYPDRN